MFVIHQALTSGNDAQTLPHGLHPQRAGQGETHSLDFQGVSHLFAETGKEHFSKWCSKCYERREYGMEKLQPIQIWEG